jgi:hypothetical protein
VGVDELHGPLPFADGGGATLGRAGADVARRQDARHRRFEGFLAVGRGAGQDEPILVAFDGVTEPFGARQRAQEEEEIGEPQALAVLERERLELAVGAVEGAISGPRLSKIETLNTLEEFPRGR